MAHASLPLVVVADDDADVLAILSAHLRDWGCRVVCVRNKRELLEQLEREAPVLLLLDLWFGEHDGLELLQQVLNRSPDLTVVPLTGHGSIDSAITAIKHGAYDYLTKPPDWVRVRATLRHAIEKQKLNERIRRLEERVEDREAQEIWGESPSTRKLRELIASVAPTDATVLIQGESGTGKELVARSLHMQGGRREKPFIPVNVAALPRELVESTLFGHERGAFTGADQPQVGCCEAADGGTLFLDEIGEMELGLQSKLLRFLQDRTVQRVGSSRTRQVNVRVVAASNRDLPAQVRAGRFREDLFYRLNVVPLVVPPLRERREDIPLLAGRFLQRFAWKYDRPVKSITAAALDVLTEYDWPGNIRQLENLLERLVILGNKAEIAVEDLPAEILEADALSSEIRREPAPADAALADRGPAPRPVPPANLPTMEQAERQAIVDALTRTRGNVRDAAQLLGRGQATVYRKIKRYNIILENLGRAPADRPAGG